MAKKIKKVDCQAHLIPQKIIEKMKNMRASDPLDQMFNTRENRFYDLEVKLKDMDEFGVDIQVLSCPIPASIDANESKELIRLINDEIADAVRRYPQRFTGLTSVDLRDVKGAIEEVKRGREKLGLKGVVVLSNVEGKGLDNPEFIPFWEEMANLDFPVFLHPFNNPVTLSWVSDHEKKAFLIPALLFMFDTSMAIIRIIFSGLYDKFPSLRIVDPHIGGIIPYILPRLMKEYTGEGAQGLMKGLTMTPGDYFKKFTYVDTVSLNVPALNCAYEILGPSKMLFASDYPFWDMGAATDTLEKSKIPKKEKVEIYSRGIDFLGLV